jgi:hypothetical protein
MAGTEAVSSQLAQAARVRAERIQLVQDTLQLPQTRQEAERRHVKLDVISARVPTLSDAELADLAARSQNVKDVVAGHHDSDESLAIVGVVLLVAGLVILAALAGDDVYDDDCYCY